ncbi:hypothetical protein GCM10010340_00340 [Streptomyces griseoloalbus]|nr:hypothetical protein GCM10010340_00340 [Streptomyces albaduncus]
MSRGRAACAGDSRDPHPASYRNEKIPRRPRQGAADTKGVMRVPRHPGGVRTVERCPAGRTTAADTGRAGGAA